MSAVSIAKRAYYKSGAGSFNFRTAGPSSTLQQLAFNSTMAFTFKLGASVACPFFMPDQRLDGDWPFPQRLPLGAGWSGTCTAAHSDVRPNEEELKTGCNVGYARQCSRLPQERTADAVRFAKGDEHDGFVHIRFAYERDYLPAQHGELIYDSGTHCWQTAHENPCLLRMAECYIESQMARRCREAGDSAVAEASSPGAPAGVGKATPIR
jgi:hypothetical protein